MEAKQRMGRIMRSTVPYTSHRTNNSPLRPIPLPLARISRGRQVRVARHEPYDQVCDSHADRTAFAVDTWIGHLYVGESVRVVGCRLPYRLRTTGLFLAGQVSVSGSQAPARAK